MKRFQVVVPDNVNADLEKYCAKFGVPKTTLGGLAIQAGLGAIIRTISPTDVFSSEQWAEIMLKASKSSGEVKLPDGKVINS